MKVFFLFILFNLLYAAQFVGLFEDNVPQEYKDGALEAMSMITNFIILKRNVTIQFKLAPLPDGIIGTVSNGIYCFDGSNRYVLIPAALYLQKYGKDRYCLDEWNPSFTVTLSSSVSFYLSGDGKNKYHYSTVLAHEICHGLGIESRVANKSGLFLTSLPSVFDSVVFNLDSNLALSSENIESLTNANLYFPFSLKYPLFSEKEFVFGTSLSHGYFGLMNYKTYVNTNYCMMDVYTINMLSTIGYEVQNCDSFDMTTACGFCAKNIPCIVSDASFKSWFLFFIFF